MATLPILEYVNSLPLDTARDADSVIYGANAGGDTKIPCNKLVSEWSETHQYSVGETTVTAAGKFYYALQANTNLDPADPANAAYWKASLGSGSGSGGNENFLSNPLHDANLAGWVASGNCSIVYSTTRDLWDGGAMAITKTAGATGTVTGDLSEIMATQIGKTWLAKIYNYIDAGATLVAGDIYFELFDGTTAIPMADSSIILAQLVAQAYPITPTNVIGSTWKLRIQFKSAAVCVMRIADCSVASQIVPIAAGSSGKIPWTPALSTGAIGTATENVAYWQRNLDNMMASWRLNQTGGTAGSGAYLITVPNGQSIDLTKKPVGSVVGYGKISNSSDELATSASLAVVKVASSTQISVDSGSGGSLAVWGSGSFQLSSALKLSFDIILPIAQWSTSMQVSAESGEYLSHDGATVVSGPSGSLFPNTALGSAASFDIPKSASDLITDYEIQVIDPFGNVRKDLFKPMSQASTVYGISSGGPSATIFRVTFTAGGAQSSGATYGALAASGDAWSQYRTNGWKWRVAKRKGGSLAEVPPVVRAEYKNQVVTAVNTNLRYTTKVEDTHGGYDVNTGRYTFPYTGVYMMIASSQNGSAGTSTLYYKINGGAQDPLGDMVTGYLVRFAETFRRNSGDYVEIFQAGNVPATQSLARFEIVYLGK